MKRNIVFFETSLAGHRYEYLKNLYDYVCKCGYESVFVLPEDERVEKWKATDARNVTIDYLSVKELSYVASSNLIVSAYRKSKILKKYVCKYHASEVFLIFLMLYMPFLLWILPKGMKITGIVYRSFLWEETSKQNWARKILEWLRYWIMAKNNNLRKVLLLNDYRSAEIFNRKFNTKKFVRLPDPYTPVDGDLENVRDELFLSDEDMLFLGFGLQSDRKGVLETLDAIALLNDEEKENKVFYFAGKVAPDIRERFYQKIESLGICGFRIFFKDEFVSPVFLNSLCAACDCIFVPYKNTNQSSGAIGYAAQYGKPVIGPSKGLLGYLIKHYRLGFQIGEVCVNDIYSAISNFKRISVPNDYVKDNQLSDFLKICLD